MGKGADGTLHVAKFSVSASCSRVHATTTTDDYQLWPHGFVMMATLYHARRVLQILLQHPCATIARLCALSRANSGHLAIMLRTLTTVGWVTRSPAGEYSTTAGASACADCPMLAALFQDVYSEACEHSISSSAGSHLPRLSRWLDCVCDGWDVPAAARELPYLSQMLAGAVIAPMLLELRMISSSYTARAAEGKHEHAVAEVSLSPVSDTAAAELGAFFERQGWGAYAAECHQLTLSEPGLFILERCPAFGVCLSYRPMLHRLHEATFGETAGVFTYEDGHEAWVDRTLNVIGSGFMHNRYFADMMHVYVRTLFDAHPLSDQPRVIADMGCGDGTLLKTIYHYIRQHTLRGRHLHEWPLLMVGVDFNEASLEETSRTLTAADVPHGTMFGDIGDPIPMQANLEAQFEVTRDQVLHVRRSWTTTDRTLPRRAQRTRGSSRR